MHLRWLIRPKTKADWIGIGGGLALVGILIALERAGAIPALDRLTRKIALAAMLLLVVLFVFVIQTVAQRAGKAP